MRQPEWILQSIRAGLPYQRQTQRPLVHNAINLSVLTGLLTLVTSAFALSTLGAWAVLPAGLALGVLFFALIILVVHEASHQMFVISRLPVRVRAWNRAFGWAASLPFGIDYARHWEVGHVAHHLHPLEPSDTQTVMAPPLGRDFVVMVAKMLFVPGYVLYWNPSRKYGSSRWLTALVVGLWGSFAAVTVACGLWTLPVSALVGFQVLGALNQLKIALEHGGAIGQDDNPFLRSRTSLFPLRPLLMPLNISLHFEHHLNFNVPWYALPRYQKVLREVVPAELQANVFNRDIRAQLSGHLGKIPAVASDSGNEIAPLAVA